MWDRIIMIILVGFVCIVLFPFALMELKDWFERRKKENENG